MIPSRFDRFVPGVVAGAIFFLGGAVMRDDGPPAGAVVLTPEQASVLDHLSVVWLDDGFGNLRKTLRFEGVNVQIVNGSGATNGNPADPGATTPAGGLRSNGLGNLILGYAEDLEGGQHRQGSHNLVVGPDHAWSSVGGVIAGHSHEVGGPFASAVGGSGHRIESGFALAAGGVDHVVFGEGGVALGGRSGRVNGDHGALLGGESGDVSGVTGTITGGLANIVYGEHATVSGGAGRFALDQYDWQGGKFFSER